MIIWRNGKSAIKGTWKTLIKGVFSIQHAVTSASEVPEVTVSPQMSTENAIIFGPMDRSIQFPAQNRTIIFPPTRRKIRL